MVEVLIIGGGIAGMMSALELTARGRSVTILDAPSSRAPASWAGGGILSPLFPWRYPQSMLPLTHDALPRYQRLEEIFFDEMGLGIEIRRHGMLLVADDIEAAARWSELANVPLVASVDSDAERKCFMPDVASIRNPWVLKRLRALLNSRGVSFQFDQAVSLTEHRNSVRIVCSSGVQWEAESALVAAGAWSQDLLASFAVKNMFFPVKGQMLLFRGELEKDMPIILRDEGYLIPRKDGKFLVGSTLEPNADSVLPTESGLNSLMPMLEKLIPKNSRCELLAQWAGIRPGCTRQVPVIDQLGERVWLNTGHYRNGLVCAPASAQLAAQLMCAEPTFCDASPYSFSSPGSNDNFCSR